MHPYEEPRILQKVKAENGKKPGAKVERIHSEELDTMAKNIAQSINGLVKITQSKVEARLVFVVRGNLEATSAVLKEIHQKISGN